MARRLAMAGAWGAVVALGTWFIYDAFVFVLLFPPAAISLLVGTAVGTWFVTVRAGTVTRRLLRSVACVVAVVGSVLDIAYVIWWGIAFDAAESETELEYPDLEPWLFGASVTCIAIAVFVLGIAWLWRGADDETRTRNILLGRQRL